MKLRLKINNLIFSLKILIFFKWLYILNFLIDLKSPTPALSLYISGVLRKLKTSTIKV